MSIRPAVRYRYTSQPDGEGGFVESIDSGITIYGEVSWYENELIFIFSSAQDVKIEDLIESADGVQYRVIGMAAPTGARYKAAKIERVKKGG